jgi:predicted ArsR family transcriptional regulator
MLVGFRLGAMDDPGFDELPRLGALAEPVRRQLYRYVVAAPRPVSRDEAADACGTSRSLAAYHLDRLVEDELLEASFERRSGRSGPGAGRPAKLYRRSSLQLQISVPPRDYEVPARLLAAAVERAGADGDVRRALEVVAHAYGVEVGTVALERAPGRARTERVRCLHDVLERRGYEPYEDGDDVRLHNCPFDALAGDHRDLVCSMNADLLRGAAETIGGTGLDATLDPRDGECCVAFLRRPR